MPVKSKAVKSTAKSKPGVKKSAKPDVPPDPMHDGSREPDEELLRSMLGKTMPLLTELRSRLADAFPSVREEWKFYGRKYGWSMKMLLGKRNLFFFAPLDGRFQIGFTFGDRAVEAVERSGIPARMKKDLRESKRYMEGRGLRVVVRSRRDVEAVMELADVKNRN
ncbi:DUF3788 domain-containing protein [bacterium]|nr:DUF3788 domain-containing protein [bacterium]